jgi:predicted ribosomally synthesized peptide with SipW-like signal peptide
MKRAYLLSIVIILSLAAVTGTLAYFTDQVEVKSVVASGSLDILQHEYERVKDANGAYTSQYQPCTQKQVLYPGSDIDKIVQIENTGKNIAYVRTFVAVPACSTANGTSTSWITTSTKAVLIMPMAFSPLKVRLIRKHRISSAPPSTIKLIPASFWEKSHAFTLPIPQ